MTKQFKKFLVYFLGVPATGKTSLASSMLSFFGSPPLISSDIIKYFLQAEYGENSLVHHKSYTAWKLVGNYSTQNIKDGFHKLSCEILTPIERLIEQAFKEHSLVFVEGAHFDPSMIHHLKNKEIKCIGVFFPLNSSNFQVFSEKKAKLRGQKNNVWVQNFKCLEILNDYLHENLAVFDEYLCISTHHENLQDRVNNTYKTLREYIDVLR